MSKCWSCENPVFDAFCSTCGVIQPPQTSNPFHLLNLDPSIDIEKKALESAYFTLQRKFHPDLFVAKSTKEKLYAQQHTIALNEAFQALKGTFSKLVAFADAHDVQLESLLAHNLEMLSYLLEIEEALDAAETLEAIESIKDQVHKKNIDLLEQFKNSWDQKDLQEVGRIAYLIQYLENLMRKVEKKAHAL